MTPVLLDAARTAIFAFRWVWSRESIADLCGPTTATALKILGSSNGTFVNGHRVQRMDLEPGDTLQIGTVAFVLQLDNDPPIEAMHPITFANPAEASGQSTPGTASSSDFIEDLIKLDEK